MNTKTSGNIALGAAIAHFTKLHYIVSLPLNDSQKYDLIIEMFGKLQKVQVKYTGQKRKGKRVVTLKTSGGNKSRNVYKPFDPNDSDELFIYCEDGTKYLIPSPIIKATSELTLGEEKNLYKITW